MSQAEANDRHNATLGRFESTSTRSRKGRRSFRVTRRHVRWAVGADPVRETLSIDDDGITGVVDGVRLAGGNLADLADAWIAHFHPEELSQARGGARECTCDDLSMTTLVLDRANGYCPLYDAQSGQYVTREVQVRACHCGFPRLLGTDLGLSWEQWGPGSGVHGADYVVAYVGRNRAREEARARRARERATLVRRQSAPVAPWAAEEATLTAHLDATDALVVTVDSFPDVTVAIRRNPDGRMNVTLTRGAETLRFRARTVGAIARRIVA